MDSPPQSPNHVFNFPENEEEFEEDLRKTPERRWKMGMTWTLSKRKRIMKKIRKWDDVEAVESIDEISTSSSHPPKTLPLRASSKRVMLKIGSTSNAHATVSAPMIITSVDEPVSQVEELSRNVHYLLRESGIKGKEAKVLKTEMKKLAKHMDSWDKDFKNEWLYTCKLEKKLCEVEDKVEKKEEEKVEMKKCVTELERMKECMEEKGEIVWLYDIIILLLRRLGHHRDAGSRSAAMERIIADRVAQAIEDHEKKRASSSNTEGSSSSGGCSHKTFMNGKPHSFNGTEGVSSRACPQLGGMGTSYFGSRDAKNIHVLNFKEMMTTEYCPDTEIQKMEQELWNLTLKGDDIETYINRFHELSLMCPELVPTENKKIKKFIKGFPERIKGNITSSKPSSLHDAVNMDVSLVENHAGKASRSVMWEKGNGIITAETTQETTTVT
ncbi:putative reverse transcriptase domain-containing protein [Tanacetum coccineum]